MQRRKKIKVLLRVIDRIHQNYLGSETASTVLSLLETLSQRQIYLEEHQMICFYSLCFRDILSLPLARLCSSSKTKTANIRS